VKSPEPGGQLVPDALLVVGAVVLLLILRAIPGRQPLERQDTEE
jgi:hypothetical protein